jgi:hypothetical protein
MSIETIGEILTEMREIYDENGLVHDSDMQAVGLGCEHCRFAHLLKLMKQLYEVEEDDKPNPSFRVGNRMMSRREAVLPQLEQRWKDEKDKKVKRAEKRDAALQRLANKR